MRAAPLVHSPRPFSGVGHPVLVPMLRDSISCCSDSWVDSRWTMVNGRWLFYGAGKFPSSEASEGGSAASRGGCRNTDQFEAQPPNTSTAIGGAYAECESSCT